MDSNQIRKTFLDFFKEKGHQIVPSAPMVIKNDPTLMFTNAGMNQFKDVFLGNMAPTWPRVADTQKCLRVSGKHNDLDEVGHDTYHHTMFEMLGNWSFGDYFKEDAISWAWELLVDRMGMNPDRIYATVFEGSEEDGVPFDQEAYDLWRKFLPEERILAGNKKDNFWEMGEVGPCGPCSEIHYDLRSNEQCAILSGAELVNKDNPLVIEIWNLVFMQFNRKASGRLEPLPKQHVDTGMGFERLCMILQGKQSNYDTDVFQVIIKKLETLSSKTYGEDKPTDIAMRVIADHLRAISFSISDGQIPSNVKAGYVIRRILRRAVRYGYTYLDFREPFICHLVATLVGQMGEQFPELRAQEQLIFKVIEEEENSFLRTLSTGITLLDNIIAKTKAGGATIINGSEAFTLYDTFGFPIDLTALIAREQGMSVDLQAFDKELSMQKERSRNAAAMETDDWVELIPSSESVFVGYDNLVSDLRITRYRKVSTKNSTFYQLVFDQTPFYANSGGQAGDTGYIESDTERIDIVDTRKENNLSVHIVNKLPQDITSDFRGCVNEHNRISSACNHTATHLLQHALRQVLGDHVEQKGSMVSSEGLRFDFSHFQKVTHEELKAVESLVNSEIRKNHQLVENRSCSISDAESQGAMMLFGEKYGDVVRTVRFGSSFELCGGTHVAATGQIGLFKIVNEGAISSGVRRIEALTGEHAFSRIQQLVDIIKDIQTVFNAPNIVPAVTKMIQDNSELSKQVETFNKERNLVMKKEIKRELEERDGYMWYVSNQRMPMDAIKDVGLMLRGEVSNLVYVVGTIVSDKPSLVVVVGDDVVSQGVNASAIIRQAAVYIQGGGGGQPFVATAGGKDIDGLGSAIDCAVSAISSALKD